jgi:hypothetical protein
VPAQGNNIAAILAANQMVTNIARSSVADAVALRLAQLLQT